MKIFALAMLLTALLLAFAGAGKTCAVFICLGLLALISGKSQPS